MKKNLSAAPLVTGGAFVSIVGWLAFLLGAWQTFGDWTSPGATGFDNPQGTRWLLWIGAIIVACGSGLLALAAKELIEKFEAMYSRYMQE